MRKRLVLPFLAAVAMFASCGGGGSDTTTTDTTSTTTTTDTTLKTTSLSVIGKVNVSEAAIKIIADSNGDGVFDESADKVYSLVSDEAGSFKTTIDAPDGKVSVTVTKDGYASYSKVFDVASSSLTLDVNLVPATVKVVSIDSRVRAAGKLTFALKKDGDVDVFVGVPRATIEDAELEVTVDTSSLPEDVKSIKASLKNFDSSDKEDIQSFPGEFVGTAPENESTEVGLESVSFALVNLEDQNGNPLTDSIVETKADTCIYEVKQRLPRNAIDKVSEKGDFDNETDGFQVPIYSYVADTGKWDYLGTGTVLYANGTEVAADATLDNSTYYYLDVCITKTNYHGYVNLDYPIYFSEVKNAKVCFVSKSGSKPLSSTWYEVYGDGLFDYAYTNATGEAVIEVPIENSESEITCDDVKRKIDNIYFSNYVIGEYGVISPDNLVDGDGDCTCYYEQTFSSEYANVTVKALDENSDPYSDKSVCLTDNDFYMECEVTDSEGKAYFEVKKGKDYTAFGRGLSESKTTVNGDVEITLNAQNNPPSVYLSVYPDTVVKGGSVNIYVSGYDIDDDNLKIESLKCGDENATISYNFDSPGYIYVLATCSLNSTGNVTVSAAVTDGSNPVSQSLTVSVVDTNTPPVIYGYTLTDANGVTVDTDKLKVNKEYLINLYAYDLEGDSLNYTASNSYCEPTERAGEFSCNFGSVGNYTLPFSVSDGSGSDSMEVNVTVESSFPPVITSTSVSADIVNVGDTVNVTATVEDSDSGNLTVSANSINGTCEAIGDGYFECAVGNVAVSEDGNIAIIVKDEDGNSDEKDVSLSVNHPPEILSLNVPESMTAGNTYTFSANATDPDGDELTYTWYLGEAEIGTGKEISYTFSEYGTFTLKVVVSDGKDSDSESRQIVILSGEENSLIFHFATEGVYVSLLDENMNIVETKISDASGVVDFGSKPSPVSVSITVSPEMVISPESFFNRYMYDVAQEDASTYIAEGKIPVDFVINQITDDPSTTVEIDDVYAADKDGDGYFNVDEFYSLACMDLDEDNDGKIEIRELGSTEESVSVSTVILKSIPVGEYDFTSSFDYNDYYHEGYDFGYGTKLVTVTVTNVPDYDYVYPYNGWWINSSYENNTFTGQVQVSLQSDGTYSLILNDSWDKFFVLKDGTDDTVVVDYNNFVDKKTPVFENDGNVSWLDIDTNYKGVKYSIGYAYNNGTSLTGSFVDPNFGSNLLLALGELSFYNDTTGISMQRGIDWVDMGVTSIPDTIDLSPYTAKLLDITVGSYANGTLTITGDDISKIDAWGVESHYYFWDNETNYNFELDMYAPMVEGDNTINFNVDPTKVIDSDIYNKYVKTPYENGYDEWTEVSVVDIADFSWSVEELNDLFGEGSYGREMSYVDFDFYSEEYRSTLPDTSKEHGIKPLFSTFFEELLKNIKK